MVSKKYFAWAIETLIQMRMGIEAEKQILKFLERFFSEVNSRFSVEKFRRYYWNKKFGIFDAVRKEDLKKRLEELKAMEGLEIKITKSKFNQGLYFIEAVPRMDNGFFN
jgi:hypothetical protein